MKFSRGEIKRAFLAAPGQVSLDMLKSELRKRAIEPVTAYELPVMGQTVFEHVQKGIRDADLVIAVVPTEISSNVMFEIGLAYGLGKNVLIFVSPSHRNFPTDIAGQVYVRADPDNRQAIVFALDQILTTRGQKLHRTMKPKSTERPLGYKVQRYLRRLHQGGSQLSEQELEKFAVEVLKETGLTVVTQHPNPRKGPDIAVWSDDLQTIVGNPLIIEVKSNLRNKQQFLHALQQVEAYRRRSNSQWALLLASAVSETFAGTFKSGCILAITITDLLKKLRNKSFSEIIRELRNARVHKAND